MQKIRARKSTTLHCGQGEEGRRVGHPGAAGLAVFAHLGVPGLPHGPGSGTPLRGQGKGVLLATTGGGVLATMQMGGCNATCDN